MKVLPKHQLKMMTEDDLLFVVKLDQDACSIEDPDMGRVTHPDAWSPESLRQFYSEKGTSIYLVKDAQGRLVGHIAYRLHIDSFEIVALSVHPKARRCGYGSVLMNHLADAVLKSAVRKQLLAYIREHDDLSMRFYKFHGFRGELVPRHFMDGEDAVKFTYDEDGTLENVLE